MLKMEDALRDVDAECKDGDGPDMCLLQLPLNIYFLSIRKQKRQSTCMHLLTYVLFA